MIEHLSYSSIALYQSCSKAWQFRYVDKVKTPTSPELIFGSTFHDAIEAHLSKTGDVLDHWHTAWNKRTEDAAIEWAADSPTEFFNLGVKMLMSDDVKQALSIIKPKHDENGAMIERKIELRVDGVPIPVIGYIDCIEHDAVCDFKTSAKSWADGKAQSELQPLFYFAALNQMNVAHDYKFRHYVFVKTKTPKVQVLETKRTEKELGFLNEIVKSVWRGIDAGVFVPNPGTWKCSPQWCEYWSMCRGKYQ